MRHSAAYNCQQFVDTDHLRTVGRCAIGKSGLPTASAGPGWASPSAAAIDRVVHHSVILEFDVPSYRTNAAQQRVQAEEVNRQN